MHEVISKSWMVSLFTEISGARQAGNQGFCENFDGTKAELVILSCNYQRHSFHKLQGYLRVVNHGSRIKGSKEKYGRTSSKTQHKKLIGRKVCPLLHSKRNGMIFYSSFKNM
jgi:hypothetical protein